MRNKEETKQKLITAVAQTFRKQGYKGLGLNKVAKTAGVSKKLIYRYFGSFEHLLETFVVETDYWMLASERLSLSPLPTETDELKSLMSTLLKNHFLQFQAEVEMQEILLWEINEESMLMQSIHRLREALCQRIFTVLDSFSWERPVNYRGIMAITVSGIYYMILHSRKNGSINSQVDITTDAGRQDIIAAINQIVELIFSLKKEEILHD